MSEEEKLPRFCREARALLPGMVSGELAGWPLHVVRAHLRRCADCSAELARQEQLATALTGGGSGSAPPSRRVELLAAHAPDCRWRS
jgi:predicted anti-sigma-YlaC factor YlaD